MNVWWVYLAPQNIPRAVVSTLGNKVVLYCIVGSADSVTAVTLTDSADSVTAVSVTFCYSSDCSLMYRYWTVCWIQACWRTLDHKLSRSRPRYSPVVRLVVKFMLRIRSAAQLAGNSFSVCVSAIHDSISHLLCTPCFVSFNFKTRFSAIVRPVIKKVKKTALMRDLSDKRPPSWETFVMKDHLHERPLW